MFFEAFNFNFGPFPKRDPSFVNAKIPHCQEDIAHATIFQEKNAVQNQAMTHHDNSLKLQKFTNQTTVGTRTKGKPSFKIRRLWLRSSRRETQPTWRYQGFSFILKFNFQRKKKNANLHKLGSDPNNLKGFFELLTQYIAAFAERKNSVIWEREKQARCHQCGKNFATVSCSYLLLICSVLKPLTTEQRLYWNHY